MPESTPPLTTEQKNAICHMVLMGCERESAAQAMRCSTAQLRQQVADDPEFSEELLRSEGMAEWHRMKAVHKAAEDEKHWRAATWWLEQKSKRRRSQANAQQVTTKELQQYLAELIDVIFSCVKCEEDRDRVLQRLTEMAQLIEADSAKANGETQDE